MRNMKERFTRQEICRELEALREDSYQAFMEKSIPGARDVLGVRMPALRRMAARMARGEWRDWAEEMKQAWKQGKLSHEERLLWAMVLGKGCRDWEETARWIRDFVPVIHNWAVCDCFCSGLKITADFREQAWELLGPYLRSRDEYESRFGAVMLLNYYVTLEWAHQGLEALDHFQGEGYYAKMGAAWALAEYFVRLPEVTWPYLQVSRLDEWTYNKALQKICESLRPDTETKKRIRALRRRAPKG